MIPCLGVFLAVPLVWNENESPDISSFFHSGHDQAVKSRRLAAIFNDCAKTAENRSDSRGKLTAK
jgi:hypothetical protein